MYNLKLTEEEMDVLMTQLGARIDHFTELKHHAMKNMDEKRFLELVQYQDIMKKIQAKMFEELGKRV